MKRFLLLSVSAGAGHGRAAEALRAEAAASFLGVEAKHIDVMTLVPRSFRALYADYYIKIVELHPAVWAVAARLLVVERDWRAVTGLVLSSEKLGRS